MLGSRAPAVARVRTATGWRIEAGALARPLAIPALLGLVTVLTRLPFRSQTLYAFDPANYAFALRDYYNVAHHHPHPPGYPLYVGAAWIINLVVREPNASLVWLSILGAAVAVAATYQLGLRLWRSPAYGLVAAVLLMTAVGFWGYSEVAYPYVFLACFTALGALGFLALRRAPALVAALVSGVGLGLMLGVRSDIALYLGPLAAALVLPRWREWKIWLAIPFGGLTILAWAIPMIQLSGGWQLYYDALKGQTQYVTGTTSILGPDGISAIYWNMLIAADYIRLTYGVLLVPVLLVLPYIPMARWLGRDPGLLFGIYLAGWPLLALTSLHVGDIGYVLALAPGLALVATAGMRLLAREVRDWLDILTHPLGPIRRRPALLDATVVLGVVAITLGIGAYQARSFLTGTGPARWQDIKLVDTVNSLQMNYVLEHFQPGEAMVLSHERFRQAQYYLKGYTVRLPYDEYAPNWQTERKLTKLPHGTKAVVIMEHATAFDPALQGRVRKPVLSTDPYVTLWVVDVRGIDSLLLGYRYVGLAALTPALPIYPEAPRSWRPDLHDMPPAWPFVDY